MEFQNNFFFYEVPNQKFVLFRFDDHIFNNVSIEIFK